ncbi:MAG: OmpA family protein [Gemmatimonadetes bacterium]|nr:OmpA family protein [Gemmatimonadota bacterium]MYH17570.1 OmpA family protein [Gemmatimonadota bacterium]MYK97827.1 OmpA family protein [Gemmatimonadota bacterium]
MRAGILVSLCFCISLFLTTPLPISAQGSGSGSAASAASAAGRITAATSALNQLSDLDAGFLIPDTYNKVQEAYDRYTRDIREGKSTRDIDRSYTEFDAALVLARERLDRVNEILMVPLEKRSAAQRANAPAMVPDAFEEAESRLERAISRLEDDRVSDAFAQGQEAAALYDDSRSSVIEMSLIGSAQIGLAEAENQDWDRLAPASFAQARRLVDEVTGALDRGEPLSAALRSKAQTADYAVRRAIEIAAQVDGLRSDPWNWERMLLAREDLVRQAADMAGVAADFLADDPQAIMTASLHTLAARQDSLDLLLQRAEEDAAALRAEVDSLHQAIEEQQIRLSSMVESYQQDLQQRKEEIDRERRELREYLYEKTQLDAAAQAQERFSDSEAIVVRDDDRLTLRLIGLSFRAGRTEIPGGARGLLEKLGEFLVLYPQTRVAVEGHTDATGAEDKNVTLSKSRADAVMQFLADQSGVETERMTSSGLGSAQPIDSNNTRRGRERNRRIDVILTFTRDL